MNVADVIRRRLDVFAVSERMTVHEAARYLRERQVRAAGVLDGGGKLVGVISQSDISDKVAAENKVSASMEVSDIMTRDLVTVTPDVALDECLLRMEKNGIYHLLVLDSEGVFRGMISVSDLLQVIASDEKARADMLESLLFPQR
jgi:predicted transcriptional regulator